MSKYADVTVAMKHAIKMDWSTQKWVSEVNLVNAINPNVVEVVRCKDCKWCNKEYYGEHETEWVWYCPNIEQMVGDEWFCADGENVTGGTTNR